MTRLRGKLWQADVRTKDGVRHRPTFKSEAEAVNWELSAKLAVELDKPLPPKTTVPRKIESRDLSLLGNLYDHVSRTEWEPMRAGLGLIRNGRDVVEHFGRNKRVADITSADGAEMKVAFADQGLAPATINRKVAALSKMLRIAKDNGIMDNTPRLRWNTIMQTKFRFLDAMEERALLAYWEAMNFPDYHDLTVLLLDTGARCFSEMIPVKWEHFGDDFKTITFWHTKTNRPRTVPLTSRCKTILKTRQKTHKGGPFAGINKHAMRSRWDTMRTTLDFDDVTPHTLRHTCCTRLVLGGVDVKRIMEWMGHTAIVTTMRYMQLRPTSLEEIVHVLEDKPAPPKPDLRVVA